MRKKRTVSDYRSTYRDFTPRYPNGDLEWYHVGVLLDGKEELISERMACEINERRMLRDVVEYLESDGFLGQKRAKTD